MRNKISALGAALASLEVELGRLLEQEEEQEGRRSADTEAMNELVSAPEVANSPTVNDTIDKFMTMQNDSTRARLEAYRAAAAAEDPALRAARRLARACANVRARLAAWVHRTNEQYSASCRFGRLFLDPNAHLGAVDAAVAELRARAAAQVS
jgi:hypothetical protein